MSTLSEDNDDHPLRGIHDVGGRRPSGPISRSEHLYADWEKRVHVMRELLAEQGLMTVDEQRRAIEGLGRERYESMAYYEMWILSIVQILTERGVVGVSEFAEKLASVHNMLAAHEST